MCILFRSAILSKRYEPAVVGDFLPSAAYNGTAGTGYGGAHAFEPVDPARTTAKPACRLLQPPNQYFTDTITLGVYAAANQSGTLANNLGIQRVKCYYEGTVREITAPTVRTFNDANGVSRSYLGWWVTLKKPAALAGHARVYFEAIPADPTMQNRVIGPYQFSPVATLYDRSITIAPTPSEIVGSRYKTWEAALDYLESVSAQNALITITEAMTTDMSRASGGYIGGQGYCTVTATAPVVFKKASVPTAVSTTLFRPAYGGLWFKGSNITIDFTNTGQLYPENSGIRDFVFEGVSLTDSAGLPHYIDGSPQYMASLIRTGYPCWFMECAFSNLSNPGTNAWLVRGGDFDNTFDDLFTNSVCVIANTSDGHAANEYANTTNAMTVTYTGGGAAATIELSGSNNAARTMTAKVDGVTVGTLSIVTTWLASTTVQNVVDWLNTLSGWSAALISNTRRAAALSHTSAGTLGGAFSAVSVKSTTVTLHTVFDVHGDIIRHGTGVENLVFVNNLITNYSTQGFFTSPVSGSNGWKDCIIVNNAMHLDPAGINAGNWQTQFYNVNSHVVFAHNSMADQSVVLRTDSTYNPDGYCIFANNLANISWAGAVDANLVITDNHMYSGSAPSGATGTTVGGTIASLLTSAATGNFTPQGALLTNLKTPVVARDRVNVARATPAPAGAQV